MVNQGAITQCLPVAPLPIRDSRQNPRVLVPEPKVWLPTLVGNTPTLGRPLFSPLPGMFLSPSLPQVELRKAELAKGLLNAERK